MPTLWLVGSTSYRLADLHLQAQRCSFKKFVGILNVLQLDRITDIVLVSDVIIENRVIAKTRHTYCKSSKPKVWNGGIIGSWGSSAACIIITG